MAIPANHVCAETQFETATGNVHSDICAYNGIDEEWKEFARLVFEEWLLKSNGTGYFYVGDISQV